MKDLRGAIAPLFLWRNEPQRAQRAQSRVRGGCLEVERLRRFFRLHGGRYLGKKLDCELEYRHILCLVAVGGFAGR